MLFLREITTAIRATLVLWVLTTVLYPVLMLGIGAIFPYQANGSIIVSQGKVVGSALIGQNFTADKYFWGRPSTTNYSSFTDKEKDPKNIGQTTGVSGASNYAPSNPDLLKRVSDTIGNLKKAGVTPTADLVYTSGSSLDPHITPEGAKAQLDRVAKARSLPAAQIEPLIAKNTEARFLGIFGEPAVNVLKLNLDLDVLKPI
ncbi:K(+)-transporting ATPase subunit C [Tumidithrix elongata RA019]|uniref:Potassium-transporting ATPase KdpC subunit n=1 Tax=Tumidithrix elongata BACA0141 TaxID=2716417 RepID=A0AAW9Q2D1_9CYAN|nr:K(+)-transporting ATPase subunit C [Tumidithrix elongata RA019]